MYKPYYYAIAFLLVVALCCCKKEPKTTPSTTTTTTTGTGTTTNPIDTSAPLDPDSIKNTLGIYKGSLHVYRFVTNSLGKLTDSSDVTYDSDLQITNPEGKKLVWVADGSLFFTMDFKGYGTNFADDEHKRQYIVFHPKERYVDYYLRVTTRDKDKGTTTVEGTEGTWYKQSN